MSRGSSHEYREAGLMSPNRRRVEIRRIIQEMRVPGEATIESLNIPQLTQMVDAGADILFRLHSDEVAGLMAQRFGIKPDAVRKVLDEALSWTPLPDPSGDL